MDDFGQCNRKKLKLALKSYLESLQSFQTGKFIDGNDFFGKIKISIVNLLCKIKNNHIDIDNAIIYIWHAILYETNYQIYPNQIFSLVNDDQILYHPIIQSIKLKYLNNEHYESLLEEIIQYSGKILTDNSYKTNYYSSTKYYWIQNFPSLMKTNFDIPENTLITYLSNFESLLFTDTLIPYDNLVYISNLLQVLVSQNFNEQFLLNFIFTMFSQSNIDNSTKIVLFFSILEKFITTKPIEFWLRNNALITQVTSIIRQISIKKYSETNRYFDWNSLLNIFQKFYSREFNAFTLNLIALHANTFKSSFHPPFSQDFITSSLKINFLILPFIVELIRDLRSMLERIYAIGVNLTETTKKIYFIDQLNSSNFVSEYDTKLFTSVTFHVFSSTEEADKRYKKQYKIVKQFIGQSETIYSIIINMLPNLLTIFNTENQAVKNTITLDIYSISMELVALMIEASYKFFLFMQYKPSQELNMQGFANIPKVLTKIVNSLVLLPFKTNSLILKGLARMLYETHQKDVVSLPLINIIGLIPRDVTSKDPNGFHSEFAYFVASMMEILYAKTNEMRETQIDIPENLYRYTLLCLRIGSPKGSGIPNRVFGSLLLFYFKTIVHSIFQGLPFTINQSTALQAIQALIDADNDIHANLEIKKNRNLKYTLRAIPVEYIRPSAKVTATNALLDYIPSELDIVGMLTFRLRLKFHFEGAWNFVTSKFSKKLSTHNFSLLPNRWIDMEDLRHEQDFFGIIGNYSDLDEETQKKLIVEFVRFTPLIAKISPPNNINRMNISFGNMGFNMIDILNAVLLSNQNSEDQFRHIFILVQNCFEILINSTFSDEECVFVAMNICMNLLFECYKFKNMIDMINGYITHLISILAPIFAQGSSFLFLHCLLDFIGTNRSSVAQHAAEIASSFLSEISKIGIDPDFIFQLLNSIIARFSNEFHLFSILTGYSLLNRFFPRCVDLQLLKSFLVQLHDIRSSDSHFISVLEMFLSNYLSNLTHDETIEYVMLLFEITCPLSTPIRTILIRSCFDLNVVVPIKSFKEINSDSPVIFMQKVTLICSIKAEFAIETVPNISSRIVEFVSKKPENMNPLEHFSRCVQFLWAASKTNQALISVLMMNEFLITQFMNIICYALASHFALLVNLCKEIIIMVKNANLSSISKSITEFCWNPEKIFQPFGGVERITFYRRLTRITPEDCSISIVDIFTNAILEYNNMPTIDKIKYLPNMVQFIKTFGVDKLMNVGIFHSKVSKVIEGSSPLYKILSTCVNISSDPEIPFLSLALKSLVKMTRNFPTETINYLCFSSFTSEDSIFFIALIIENDKSFELLNELIRLILSMSDNHIINVHPFVFRILTKFEMMNENVQNGECLIKKLFNIFYSQCSDDSKVNDYTYAQMFEILLCMISIIKFRNNIEQIIDFAKIFEIPFFSRSYLYFKFINEVIKSQNPESKHEIIKYIIEHIDNLPQSTSDLFISHCIGKDLFDTIDLLFDIINSHSLSNTNYDKVFIHAIYRLLKVKIPSDEKIKSLILNQIQRSITSQDGSVFIYSLKISTILLKNNKLSCSLFNQISCLILSFTKFMADPFLNHVAKFIKLGKNFLYENISQISLKLCFHFRDRNMPIPQLICLGKFFIKLPFLLEFLPLSYHLFILSIFDEKIKVYKSPAEISDLCFHIGEFFTSVETDIKIYQLFVDKSITFILYMMKIFKINLFDVELIHELFKSIIEKRNVVKLNPSFVSEISEKNLNHYTFGLVVLATVFMDENQIIKAKPIIISTLRYIVNQNFVVNRFLYESLITSICRYQNAFNEFKVLIFELLDYILENLTIDSMPVLTITLKTLKMMTEFKNKPIFNELHAKKIAQKLNDNPFHPSSVFIVRTAIDLLEFDMYYTQIEFIQGIVHLAEGNEKSVYAYAEVFAKFPYSDKISQTAKDIFISNFPIIIQGVDSSVISNVIKLMKPEQISNEFDIKMHFILAKRTDPTTCIQELDYIRKRIPENICDALLYLSDILPVEFWGNQFIPIMAGIICPKDKNWYPIFALSSCYDSFPSDLLTPILINTFDESKIINYQTIFQKLIQNRNNLKLKNAIESFLNLFRMKNIPFPAENFLVAEKLTNSFSFDIISKVQQFDMQNLTPHPIDWTNFSILQEKLSTDENVILSLYALGNFESAINCFTGNEYNEMFLKIYDDCKMNAEINLENMLCNSLLFSEQAVDKIVSADRYLEEGRDDDVLSCVDECYFMLNKLYAKHHNQLKKYDIEKLLLACNILSIMKNKAKSLPLLELPDYPQVFNYYWDKFLKSFFAKYKGTKFTKLNSTGGEVVFFVDKQFENDFDDIVCLSNRRLIGIGIDQINLYFNRMDAKITNNEEITPKEMIRFAHFSYHFFILSPSFMSFKVTYTSYYHVLKSTIDQSSKQVALARILMLLKFASSFDEVYLYQDLVKELSSIFDVENESILFRYISELVEISKTDWIFDIVSKIFQTASRRAILYCRICNHPRLKDLEAKSQSVDNASLMVMSTTAENIEVTFQILLHENYLPVHYIIRFAREISKLPKEQFEQINWEESRKNYSIAQNYYNNIPRKIIEKIDLNHLHEISSDIHSLFAYLDEIFGNATEMKQKISSLIADFNKYLPFVFTDQDMKSIVNIIRVYDDVHCIYPDLFVINFTSSLGEFNTLAVQRHDVDQTISMPSFLSIVNCIHDIFNRNYATSTAFISIRQPQNIEFNERFSGFPFFGEYISLRNLFLSSTGETIEDWVEQNIDQNGLNSYGENSIENFDTYCLHDQIMRKAYFANNLPVRNTLLRYFCGFSFIREIFDIQYLSLSHFIIDSKSFQFALVFNDFRNIKTTDESSIRISPNIANSFVSHFTGEVILSLSACSSAIINELESFRSFSELYFSHICENSSEVITRISLLEEKITKLCAPQSSESTKEECVSWYTDMNELIQRSMNPIYQPVHEIPWF